ncbi:MAG: hypothetical protein JWL75_577 [Parcubacteria group bacterium]|nr:hypothetical protein [Parcubacteria group bacterium]
MPDFKKNFRSSGPSRPSFNRSSGGGYGGSRDSRGGNRDFAQKEMFDAECSKCHGPAQVPFRPNGKKPVFCAKCFTQDNERGGSDRDSGSSYGHAPKRDFGPARPRFDAPSAPAVPDRTVQELKTQVERMNATLEKLVTAVDTFNRATALTKEIRKHFPADKPAAAPVKKAAKETAKSAPAAKKVAAKKPVKSAKSSRKA